MKYLLDTNTCIQYINGRSVNIIKRIEELAEDEAALCSIVVAELVFGAYRSKKPVQTLAKQQKFVQLFHSLPFDDTCTITYAKMRAELLAKGTPIGGNDLLIAAIAKTHELILVTHNTREFRRVEGLLIEDWE